MKHYVVVNDWANEYESGTTILGVAHSLEEAKEIFNQYVDDEKAYAEEHGFRCEKCIDGEHYNYLARITLR